jgi:putative ABC transport system permease protein
MRVLAASPGYSLAVVLTLALAIGANAVIFSFANVLAIRPLPIAEPEQLAWIYSLDPQRGNPRARSSYPDFVSWRDGLRSVEALAAVTADNVTMTGAGEPERLEVNRTSASLQPIWGLKMLSGRFYRPSEDAPGAPCVAVLAHHFWKERFRGSPDSVGTSVTLDGRSCEIVGVLAPDIEIGNLTTIDLWMPLAVDATRAARGDRRYSVIGKRRPGVTLAQVDAEVKAISERSQREYPDTNAGWSSRAAATREAITGPDTWIILGLLGAVVSFILLIACANVANLMLARATGRRGELAIRTALGASRWRVVRQLVTESLLLGVLGGAVGLAFAGAGLKMIRAVASEPFFELVTIDRNVLLFGLALSFLAPLLFSVLPAAHTTGADAGEALKQSSARTTGGAARRTRHALVVSQVALSLALLVVSGLIVRTMIAITRADLGLDPDRLLTLRMELPEWKYDEARVAPFYDDLLRAIEALPGVDGVGAASRLPVIASPPSVAFAIEGRPDPRAEERPWAARVIASPGFFGATGIPLIAGRPFATTDDGSREPVAVVSAEAARRYWKTPAGAIGARVSLKAPGEPPSWTRIIGVVADVANANIERAPDPHLYLPMAQQPERAVGIVVRSEQPAALFAAVRGAIRAGDPELAISDLRTMAQAMDEDRSSSLVLTGMFVAFGVIALALAFTGLYGVIAFSVGQREQEIGLRVALGARPGEIRGMILRQGARLVAIGCVVGLAGAWGITQTIRSVLYGVTPLDPVTYVTVFIAICSSAAVATWLPARRAAKLDPVRSLRT